MHVKTTIDNDARNTILTTTTTLPRIAITALKRAATTAYHHAQDTTDQHTVTFNHQGHTYTATRTRLERSARDGDTQWVNVTTTH